jgi:hypothetical protein
MDVQGVDPRDIEIEVPDPIYRVYFWNADRSHSWEYELTGAASIYEVIDWAREHANRREFELLVVDGNQAYTLAKLTF